MFYPFISIVYPVWIAANHLKYALIESQILRITHTILDLINVAAHVDPLLIRMKKQGKV